MRNARGEGDATSAFGALTPSVAQKLMCHSDIRLTMNSYTDPVLLDVGAAFDALLAFEAAEPPVMATLQV